MQSIKGADALKCPKCGETFDAEYWSVIDAGSAPELREAACGGELNLLSCPECKAMFYHDTNLIYLDSAIGLLVFVFAPGDKHKQAALKAKMEEDFSFLKQNFKDTVLPSCPLYVFGLEELKQFLDAQQELVNESEVVAAAAASLGYKVVCLNPAYARERGYPLYVPAKAGNDNKDFAASSAAVLKSGVKAKTLKKFADDLDKKGITPEIL